MMNRHKVIAGPREAGRVEYWIVARPCEGETQNGRIVYPLGRIVADRKRAVAIARSNSKRDTK